MLEIKNLTKRYGNFYALRNLNLTVEDGELFGFVGANGAGKTTTMRICVGLLDADSGEVFIDGKRMLSLSNADSFTVSCGMKNIINAGSNRPDFIIEIAPEEIAVIRY